MCHLILYDGVCGLFNRLVQFVLKRDENERFGFAGLQSELAQKVLNTHGLEVQTMDTVVVIENDCQSSEWPWTRSLAVLFICGQLGGIWTFNSLRNRPTIKRRSNNEEKIYNILIFNAFYGFVSEIRGPRRVRFLPSLVIFFPHCFSWGPLCF